MESKGNLGNVPLQLKIIQSCMKNMKLHKWAVTSEFIRNFNRVHNVDIAWRPVLHVGRRLFPRAHDHPKATPDVHQGMKLSSSSDIFIAINWFWIQATEFQVHINLKARIFGIDLSKRRPEPPDEPEKIPEATGVITGCVFLMVTILLIPMTFSRYLVSGNSSVDKSGTINQVFFIPLSNPT